MRHAGLPGAGRGSAPLHAAADHRSSGPSCAAAPSRSRSPRTSRPTVSCSGCGRTGRCCAARARTWWRGRWSVDGATAAAHLADPTTLVVPRTIAAGATVHASLRVPADPAAARQGPDLAERHRDPAGLVLPAAALGAGRGLGAAAAHAGQRRDLLLADRRLRRHHPRTGRAGRGGGRGAGRPRSLGGRRRARLRRRHRRLHVRAAHGARSRPGAADGGRSQRRGGAGRPGRRTKPRPRSSTSPGCTGLTPGRR